MASSFRYHIVVLVVAHKVQVIFRTLPQSSFKAFSHVLQQPLRAKWIYNYGLWCSVTRFLRKNLSDCLVICLINNASDLTLIIFINLLQTQSCLNGGTCTNLQGSYRCNCPLGFGGVRCEVNINDCASNPCLSGGTCTDGVNFYTCACLQGSTVCLTL